MQGSSLNDTLQSTVTSLIHVYKKGDTYPGTLQRIKGVRKAGVLGPDMK
jgi:hypothetical protein